MFQKLCIFFLALLLANNVHSQLTQKIYLSGTGNDNTRNWDFYCSGGSGAGKWTTIKVPSCWELQGFGKYDYGFAKDSTRGKETGLYRTSFDAPAGWTKKIIKLVFEGVMTDAEVHINGQLAGLPHQGAFYAFSYDITKYLKEKNNLLEVKVAKHSANESVNAAERRGDFWIFGGIFRPVYLDVLPQQYIDHIAIDAKADGSFHAVIKTNITGAQFSLQVKDKQGHALPATQFTTTNAGNVYQVSCKFSSTKLWTPETPHLYTAVLMLKRAGRSLHKVRQSFGFRTIEVRQRDGIYVNGVKVKMKGVNRHSFWPTSGRTTSKALSIEDVQLMKDMNMNAVRMSHYPPDDHFLDVCDSLGLFVMDELAGWHGMYDVPTGSKLLAEMIEHDVIHPSIIFWANGNEGGHNFSLDSLFDEYDVQQRPVVHPWQLFGGIETQHYREYNYGIGNYDQGREIVMPTEFLHGQFDGGHGAGLEDYWKSMWSHPRSAGGFLWDFADEGVVRKDRSDSIDTDKFHGADGIVGPFHEKEGSYFAIKEIWCPIQLEPKIITPDFNGTLNIENQYFFTNTNACSFSFSLRKIANNRSVNGNIAAPDIKPGAKGSLQIKLPTNWKQFDVLYLTAHDPFGKELFTWSLPITEPKDLVAALQKENTAGKAMLISGDRNDSVQLIAAGNLVYGFHKKSGQLISVRKNNVLIPWGNGPVLCEGSAVADSVVFQAGENSVIVHCYYAKKSLIHSLNWTINGAGIAKMEIHYFPAAYFTNTVGVNFSFPEASMKSVSFLGNGPYRVWKNRMKGTKFGVWNKAYNNTETGESWNYPEFKGYYSNLYWVNFVTANGNFKVYTETEDLFLRLYTPAWKTDEWHNYEPIFPGGDISFMQGISSIGSKTQRNETTGPMGVKNIFYDYEKDGSRALKMVLYFDFNDQ